MTDPHDTGKLKQKLELLGEPPLPASLSAEALFRRMDSGELTLPEEEPAAPGEAPETASAKVIPWAKVMKRTLPAAACLALVLLLYRGQTVFAKNFSGGASFSTDQRAPAAAAPAPSSAAAAEDVPEVAMYSEETTETDLADAAPEETEPAPAPSLRMSPATGETKGTNDSPEDAAEAEKDARMYNSGAADGEAKQKAEDAAGDTSSDSAVMEDPAEDLNPDIGWGPEEETPPIFTFQELEPSMLAIAAENAPGEGLAPVISWYSWNNRQKDKFVFTVHYQNADGQEAGILTFYCHLDPAAEKPEVAVDACGEGVVVR